MKGRRKKFIHIYKNSVERKGEPRGEAAGARPPEPPDGAHGREGESRPRAGPGMPAGTAAAASGVAQNLPSAALDTAERGLSVQWAAEGWELQSSRCDRPSAAVITHQCPLGVRKCSRGWENLGYETA